MFWSDWGAMPKIEPAGMDGSCREVIMQETVSWPNGLTLDLVLDKLYWVDAKLNTIGCSNLDGSRSRTVLFSRSSLHHPFSISVFEDLMYWSDWNSHTINQASKFTGTNITRVTTTSQVKFTPILTGRFKGCETWRSRANGLVHEIRQRTVIFLPTHQPTENTLNRP